MRRLIGLFSADTACIGAVGVIWLSSEADCYFYLKSTQMQTQDFQKFKEQIETAVRRDNETGVEFH